MKTMLWKIVKTIQLGAFMHLLAGFFLIAACGGFAAVIHGRTLPERVYGGFYGVTALGIFFIYEILVVYKGLYQKRYLRMVRILNQHGWSDAMARTQMFTPCQRLALRIAASDTGFKREAVEFLRRNPLPLRWIKKSREMEVLRHDSGSTL